MSFEGGLFWLLRSISKAFFVVEMVLYAYFGSLVVNQDFETNLNTG